MKRIKRNLADGRYNALNLDKYDLNQLQQEYDRMRNIAVRNIERIENSDDFSNSEQVRKKYLFEKSGAEYDNKTNLILKLSEVDDFLTSDKSTLTGLRNIRKKAVQTLQLRGYKGVTNKNYNDFIKYIQSTDSIATSILKYRYDSRTGTYSGQDKGKRLKLFDIAQKKNISINAITRDFSYFIKHIDEIDKLPNRTKGRVLGTKSIKRMLKEM